MTTPTQEHTGTGAIIGTKAEDYVLVQGIRDTRATLAAWHDGGWTVLGKWLVGAIGIAVVLLSSVWVVAKLSTPDISAVSIAGVTHDSNWQDAGAILYRNSLVLALHAMACVAGFIAGSSLPQVAASKTGLWRKVHDLAGPAAIVFVGAATTFSLSTQAYYLGSITSDISYHLNMAPAELIVLLLPHALPELIALFLPLAAWLIASRADDWHHLMAATFVTVAIAVPMLLASCAIELLVTPRLIISVI
jgi:hypothetical protein